MYDLHSESKYKIGDNITDFNERIKYVDTYNVNNSMIASVDEKGRYLVAPLNKDRVEALKKAGYKKDSSLYVPFSNSEYHLDKVLKRN